MKKRLGLLALVMCLVFTCCACKKNEDEKKDATPTKEAQSEKEDVKKVDISTDPTTVEDLNTLITDTEGIDLKNYIVALGKYKGVEVEVLSTEVTKEEIQEEIDYLLESFPSYEDLDQKEAQDGNYVNIDFVGKIDGKEFEGGSAEDTVLLIGSNSYIDGFEEGIIGMKIDESKDVPLTFPKDYHNTDYAGKDVVFTITLNRIMKQVDTKYTDEFIKENFYEGYKLSTTKEMDKYIENYLLTDKKETASQYKIQTVLDKIVTASEFEKLPQEWVNAYYVEELSYYETVAASQGATLEQLLSSYKLSLDQFKKDCLEYATRAVQEDIVLFAIAEAEKMEITDDEYAKLLNEKFKDYSAYYEDVNEFVEDNGGKAEISKKFLFIKARDFVVDNATVVGTIDEIPTEEEDKESEDKESEDKESSDEETEDKEEDKKEDKEQSENKESEKTE